MYLFCDIDGVLIPFPAPDGAFPATHHPDHIVPAGQDQPVRIWLNPAHGPLLADLVAATGLEPVWCTSWRGDASRLIGHRLGLPPWPHVDLPRLPLTTSHPDGYLWKRDYLTTHARHQGLAWIDDDFAPADHDWAAERTTAGHPTLLIQPDPRAGLQAEHAQNVMRWAADLKLPHSVWQVPVCLSRGPAHFAACEQEPVGVTLLAGQRRAESTSRSM